MSGKMRSLRHDISLRFVKLLNVALITVPFGIVWYLFYGDRIAAPYWIKGNLLVVALFCILYVVFGKIYEAFQVSLSRVSEMVCNQALAALAANGLMYVIIFLLTKHLPNPLPLLLSYIGQIGCAALWSTLAQRWYYAVFPPKRTAIIYDQREGVEQLIQEYGMERKFQVVEQLSDQECIAAGCRVLHKVDAVFLCGVHSHERNVILKHCVAQGVCAYVMPRIGDTIMSGARPIHMFHLPILHVQRSRINPEYALTKRLFDLICASVGLILTSPILLVTAIAIKATDGGPVFYRQQRLTKDGKPFDVLKFRSMRVDAEKDGVARLSTGADDQRVTPVGKVIRRFRIDELPQLFCVLRGHMGMVGPRPERPEIAAQYEETLPEFGLRLQVKAGLTGYAQVYGKYNTTPYDKLQMDLMYIANLSLAEDLRICLSTLKVLFTPESTEGVTKGAVTAGEEAGDPVAQEVHMEPTLTASQPAERTTRKAVG